MRSDGEYILVERHVIYEEESIQKGDSSSIINATILSPTGSKRNPIKYLFVPNLINYQELYPSYKVFEILIPKPKPAVRDSNKAQNQSKPSSTPNSPKEVKSDENDEKKENCPASRVEKSPSRTRKTSKDKLVPTGHIEKGMGISKRKKSKNSL